MPKTRIRVPVLDFAGGLNEDDQPSALQPNELRIARNVFWKGRALSSRRGSDRLQSTAINSAAAGVGVWQLARNQGVDRDNIAVFGNKIYKDVKNASPTDITGAVVITAGANNHVCFVHFNDLALMCNGTDSPWKWSGSGNVAALGGSPPAFKTMVAKWNRVFGAGHAAAPRTIRHSAMGDPETWAAASTVAAILGDATSAIEGRDFIYQLDHLGDSIFVGLENSIGRVLYTGDSTTPFRYNQIAEFGVEGAHSYVPVGPGGYFLSRRGVHYVRPTDVLITYESSMISGRRLHKTWDTLNKARIQRTYGTSHRTADGNLLVLWPLTTGTGSVHDIVLVMDVTDGPGKERFAWWTGWDANAMVSVPNATTLAAELLFTSTVGFVWQGDNDTNDQTSAYIAEAATRWEDFGVPSDKKNLRDIYIEANQAGAFDLTIETYFDYSPTPATAVTQSLEGAAQAKWGTAIWGTDKWASLGYIRAYLFGTEDGVVISHRIYTDGADEPWSVYKLVPAVEAVGEAIESN